MSQEESWLQKIDRRQLREALISAFPDESDLEILLQDEMEIRLNTVAGGKTYRETVFNLVKWAESQGKLLSLFEAAHQVNPGNAELNRIVQSLKLTELQARKAHYISDVKSLPTPPRSIRQRWALLVGINQYATGDFAPLRFCVNDVQALEGTLTNLGYTVICLHDELDHDDPRFPTRNNIEAELTKLCQVAGTDDLVWAHFACHGTLFDQKPVLIVRDTRHVTLAKTALPLADVEGLLRGSQAKRLVLTLDACHVGVEIGRDVFDPTFVHNAYELAEGFALIAASTAQQVSQEWREVKHGVFTYYLLQGLVGKADHSEKGFVTVNDLQIYVLDQLKRWNVKYGGRIQEPTFRVDGLGDMILVKYTD